MMKDIDNMKNYTIKELELIIKYLGEYRRLNLGKPERNDLKSFAHHLVNDYENAVKKFIYKEEKK